MHKLKRSGCNVRCAVLALTTCLVVRKVSWISSERQSGDFADFHLIGFGDLPEGDDFLSWSFRSGPDRDEFTSLLTRLRRCHPTCKPYTNHPCESTCHRIDVAWEQFSNFTTVNLQELSVRTSYRTLLSVLQTYVDYGSTEEANLALFWTTLTETARWNLSIYAYFGLSICGRRIYGTESVPALMFKNDIMMETFPRRTSHMLNKATQSAKVNLLGCLLLRDFIVTYKCNVFSSLAANFPRARKGQGVWLEFCEEVAVSMDVHVDFKAIAHVPKDI